MDPSSWSRETKIAGVAAVGAVAFVGLGAYIYLMSRISVALFPSLSQFPFSHLPPFKFDSDRGKEDGVVREISPPISTHHNMQVERKPDGHLIYHDKIKEEVDRINDELDRRAARLGSSTVSSSVSAASPSASLAAPTRRCNGVILCGAPGSGKGTQCERAIAELKFSHLSTGDMLRDAIKEGSDLGKKSEAYMRAGKLVPDELVIGIVQERLLEPSVLQAGWILDGFPRTAVQAQALEDAGCSPDKVILLDVPDAILLERITGRRMDPQTGAIYHMKFKPPPNADVASRLIQRSDDSAEKLAPRLRAYHDHVDAILAFYRNQRNVRVVTIDGNRKAEAVYADIRRELMNADS